MSVLRPRHNRKTYSIPSENDSDIQESPSDLEASRFERKEMSSTPLRPISNDEEYVPTTQIDSSSESDENIIKKPEEFDPDAFTRKGRTLRWPDGSQTDILNIGCVYTSIFRGQKEFVVPTTEKLRNLFRRTQKDRFQHMAGEDTVFERKNSPTVQRRTQKKRIQSSLLGCVRFLRTHHILTVSDLDAIYSEAFMQILRNEYGDLHFEDLRSRMVNFTDANEYLSTWESVSITTPDAFEKMISAHDLSGVDMISELLDIPNPVFVQAPRSTPDMSPEAFAACVERVKEFLNVIKHHPDWSLIPVQGIEWISNHLAGRLFLYDEASLYGWTVKKESLGVRQDPPSFWHSLAVTEEMEHTNLGQLILENRTRI